MPDVLTDRSGAALVELPEAVVVTRCRPAIARAAAALLGGAPTYLELEDFVQTGSMALLGALRALRNGSASFGTSREVWAHVWEALLEEMRAASADHEDGMALPSNSAESDLPSASSTAGYGEVGWHAHAQEALVLAGQLWSAAQRAIAYLSWHERVVLMLYYFHGATMREVGMVLGVTESRASQLHRCALETLRRRLGRFQ